jgi:two-component system sensor histidine kinase KdpD
MSAASFVALGVLIVALLVAIGPLGRFMAKVYDRDRAPGDRVFKPVENWIYRVLRIDPQRGQRWNVYTLALLAFSLVSVLTLYLFQRIQTWLPLSNGLANVDPKTAGNTAISFVTNTNWQSYSGESTMGHLVQMAGLAVQNFVSAAVVAFLLSNWFFTPPIHALTIEDPENVTALIVFIVSAVVASVLVDRVASRRREALQARAEATALAHTSGILIGEPDPLPQLLDQLRTTFGFDAVSLLSNRDDGWVVDAASGADPPTEPFEGERWDLVEDGSAVLVLRGAHLTADDQRVLRTFLSNLAVALHSRRLQADAEVAAHLVEADALRTALLQAVSHDLRTPLASIKASATSLLQSDVAWTSDQRLEFAHTIDTEADRLNRVVTNLLDMSRLQAGAVTVASRPVYLEDVVATALATVDHDPRRVIVTVPETVPPVEADPALLERAVANIVANALAWSPPDAVVRVEAAAIGTRVHLRVIDRGPGVGEADRERVFQPFQRLGDRSTQAGVGLGLAVARGFVHVLGGEIVLDDTPGGGLTVVFDLPPASDRQEVPVE